MWERRLMKYTIKPIVQEVSIILVSPVECKDETKFMGTEKIKPIDGLSNVDDLFEINCTYNNSLCLETLRSEFNDVLPY